MSRLIASATNSDAILGTQAYGHFANQPMLDLANGGQHGFAPNLAEWVSSQAYVRGQLRCVLLEAPKFMQLMPEPKKWVEALRALVELHPKTIEGLKGGLAVTFEQHAIGANEMMDEITNVTRERSEPVFTYTDLYGMPIATFLYNWITYGMMDADTKYAMINTLPGIVKPTDFLADWSAMSCLFFETDPTFTKVTKSWVCANMMPKLTGDIIGKKDLTSAGEMSELSIEFTAITQFTLGGTVMAQNILNGINITNANPNLRASFIKEIAPDVLAAKNTGLAANVQSVATSAVIR